MTTSAPVHGAAAAAAPGESAAWARFAATEDAAEFHAAWLAILCAQIGRVQGAMLLLGREGESGFGPVAVWPDASRDMRYLSGVAERALKEKRGVVQGSPGLDDAAAGAAALPAGAPKAGSSADMPKVGASAHVGYPVQLADVLHGAVVLDLGAASGPELQRALRLLHWASAWLTNRLWQDAHATQQRQLARSGMVHALVATSLQASKLGPSALALVNELATRLGCERVSLGLAQGGSMRVQAISHTAQFDRRSAVAGQIGDAMDEVLDLSTAIVWPLDGLDGAPNHGTDASLANDSQLAAMAAAAHATLARAADRDAICSVPVLDQARTVGVLTLERRGQPFDADAVALCQAVGVLLGPVFALKQAAERSLWRRIADQAAAARSALFGPGHPGLKLVSGVLLVALLAITLVPVPHRVAARTLVEGAVQRAAVAPFDGFLAEGLVRAGDLVKAGQPMARLVDRDLLLEQARWHAERELAERRYRQVAAITDRAAMAMAQAQTEQAQAQLSLVDDRLARATVRAPFDGVVVAGDLTQLQGAPVELGKLLFEVAPLDRWRVVLEVDERDMRHLQPGQAGQLAVSGLPQERLAFVVQRITPISTPQDGRNFFRVEASLQQPSARLRPGMEGVGKVDVGRASLLWIWTHGFTDWLNLAWWKFVP